MCQSLVSLVILILSSWSSVSAIIVKWFFKMVVAIYISISIGGASHSSVPSSIFVAVHIFDYGCPSGQEILWWWLCLASFSDFAIRHLSCAADHLSVFLRGKGLLRFLVFEYWVVFLLNCWAVGIVDTCHLKEISLANIFLFCGLCFSMCFIIFSVCLTLIT